MVHKILPGAPILPDIWVTVGLMGFLFKAWLR